MGARPAGLVQQRLLRRRWTEHAYLARWVVGEPSALFAKPPVRLPLTTDRGPKSEKSQAQEEKNRLS